MVKLLLQGVGCVCGCMVLYAGFFCLLVVLSDDARLCSKSVKPLSCGVARASEATALDEVIDRLEADGKAEVAARLCNSLPPVSDKSTDF